tara:strand:+ start:5667 stop:6419 length:753 start_codon:yes stop_codon:yes gene_type:complete
MTNNIIYFIANWKMYGNSTSVNSINRVISLSKTKKFRKTSIIYCPPYTLLNQFTKKTKRTRIQIGAQNCHAKNDYGANTGSINSKMIKNAGCKFVIIGHSENRKDGDTDKDINNKIKSALKEKLKVIFCIGESLDEKRKRKTHLVLKRQLIKGLHKIKNIENIFIAYEPIWSIGTGIIPKINDLKKQVRKIKFFLLKKFKNKNVKILYGGSVSSKNIKSFSQIYEIKGFLIGGASQNSKKFIDIMKKTIN